MNTCLICKTKIVDLIKINDSYMICVDVYNKFHDGQIITTTKAEVRKEEYSSFSPIYIE